MAKPQPKQPYNLNPEPVRLSLIAPLFALVLIFLPVPPWVVEDFYSRDMYPWLQNIFTTGTNFLPLALLDALLIALVLATVFRVRRLFNVMRQRGVFDAMWEGMRRVVRIAGLGVILFFWAWGFNYRRQPLETALPEKNAPRPTLDQLQAAVIESNSLAARLRPLLKGPELGYPEIAPKLKEPLNAALKKLGRPLLAREGRPKYSLILTPFFSSSGITGMVNPLGLETIVNPDLLPHQRPFVLAREWARLSGHADEGEASAVAWLACMYGGPELAYSASLYLIQEAAAALPDENRRTVLQRLESGIRGEVDAMLAQRTRTDSSRVQRPAERATDEYLKTNPPTEVSRRDRRALALILLPSMKDVLGTYQTTRAEK
jgi:hypothetical protein